MDVSSGYGESTASWTAHLSENIFKIYFVFMDDGLVCHFKFSPCTCASF